jgi:hypothetical protein
MPIPKRYVFGGSAPKGTEVREVILVVGGQEPGETFSAEPGAAFVHLGDFDPEGQTLEVRHTDVRSDGRRLKTAVVRVTLPDDRPTETQPGTIEDEPAPATDAGGSAPPPAEVGPAPVAEPVSGADTGGTAPSEPAG